MTRRHRKRRADPGDPALERLANALQELVAARYPPPARLRGRSTVELFADTVDQLSRRFTSDREQRRAGYLSDPRQRAAYLLYFVPTGAATAMAALDLAGVAEPGTDAATRPIRVLDLGCGPLSATIGVGLQWPHRALEVVAVDTASAPLRDGAQLLGARATPAEVRTVTADLRDHNARRRFGAGHDLAIAANVFNEWPWRGGAAIDEAAGLCTSLLRDHLADDGTLLIIEPAARSPSRRLIALRDRLAELMPGHIVAPCLGAPVCPLAGAGDRSWCHAERPWQRPRLVQDIDRAIGHRRATLKFSYLAISPKKQPRSGPDAWRVIGGPMRDDADLRRYLCGPDGRVVAHARGRLPGDHPLVTAWRGGRIELAGTLMSRRRGRREERVLRVEAARRSQRPGGRREH